MKRYSSVPVRNDVYTLLMMRKKHSGIPVCVQIERAVLGTAKEGETSA